MRPLPTVSGNTVEKERRYLATVIFNKEDGKYDIEWEGDYGNAIKDAEDIAPAGHRHSTSDHDCLVEQSRAVHGPRIRVLSSLCVTAVSVVLLQVWASTLMKNPCVHDEQHGMHDWTCSMRGIMRLEGGGALLVGVSCITVYVVISFGGPAPLQIRQLAVFQLCAAHAAFCGCHNHGPVTHSRPTERLWSLRDHCHHRACWHGVSLRFSPLPLRLRALLHKPAKESALMDGIIEWWGTSGPKPDDGVTWDDIKFVTRAKKADSDKRHSAAANASSQPSAAGDAAWPRRVGCLPR
mmetsp:Transcript_84156/g.162406  ORF Transcript_84156/g.162406 Transcript_84156/m.162406 type:complete len:294 (-) Transcript_84156:42-923(-)